MSGEQVVTVEREYLYVVEIVSSRMQSLALTSIRIRINQFAANPPLLSHIVIETKSSCST